MNNSTGVEINDHWIRSLRGSKNTVVEQIPYYWLVEKELAPSGGIVDVGIIFLTNNECPYTCLMCDLWKNTTDKPVKAGSIPAQIEYALSRMPAVKHIKLYNSGSFFDTKAIPASDYSRIAEMLKGFERVVVECHPRLVNEKISEFSRMLEPRLEVAMGLESANPDILKLLNKKMTMADYSVAVRFLNDNDILSRAFVLLRPPFMSENEGIEWAIRSVEFAFEQGTGSCTILPVRGGNGAMEKLRNEGHFSPPKLKSLEYVHEKCIKLGKGLVFADTWDLELFSDCGSCFLPRKERIETMNLTQVIPEPVYCTCS